MHLSTLNYELTNALHGHKNTSSNTLHGGHSDNLTPRLRRIYTPELLV